MIPASDAPPLARAGSTAPARRLLDPLRERVRYLHGIRTEKAYQAGGAVRRPLDTPLPA